MNFSYFWHSVIWLSYPLSVWVKKRFEYAIGRNYLKAYLQICEKFKKRQDFHPCASMAAPSPPPSHLKLMYLWKTNYIRTNYKKNLFVFNSEFYKTLTFVIFHRKFQKWGDNAKFRPCNWESKQNPERKQKVRQH